MPMLLSWVESGYSTVGSSVDKAQPNGARCFYFDGGAAHPLDCIEVLMSPGSSTYTSFITGAAPPIIGSGCLSGKQRTGGAATDRRADGWRQLG